MLIVQLTDFHVTEPGTPFDDRFRTAERLAEAVRAIRALNPAPAAIVCTGDLVDTGTEAAYARLVALLAPLEPPVYVLPGNHDNREHLRRAFAGRGYLPGDGFLCYAVALGPLRLIALDTQVPGEPGGRLCDERLAWLDARLAEAPDTPTIIAQHHPPFATGIGALDRMGLAGATEEARLLARHRQVERVICGHVHRPILARVGGTVATTCPSTAHQVVLDLREPGQLAIVPEPPALQVHAWRDGALVTHTAYVGDHGAPFVVPGY